MADPQVTGLVTLASAHSLDRTIAKLRALLAAKEITEFALIDHSGEAARVGLDMPPTKVLIFGNPKAGTPLMLAAPGIAIDLPLKLLVREDTEGAVWISYTPPEALLARHGLGAEFAANLAAVAALATAAAE